MPSHFELLQLSQDAYYKDTRCRLPEWQRQHYFNDGNTGLSFSVYSNEKRNQTVIAFRDSDNASFSHWIKNMATNFMIALGLVPNTTHQALQEIERFVKGKNDSLVCKVSQSIKMFVNGKNINYFNWLFILSQLEDLHNRVFSFSQLHQLFLTGHSLGG